MKKILYLALATGIIATSCKTLEIDRTTPPKSAAAPQINIGNYEKFQLDNGLTVIVVENHKLPKVSFQLTVNNDPVLEGNKVGYTTMAGDLISAGTTSKTKAQIDEEVDFIGADLTTYSNGIYASSLKKHTDKLLGLTSDIILNPAFPAEELEKSKKQALSALKSSKTNPDAIINNVAGALRNGKDHPFGEVQTKSDVENITIEDCKSYYETYFRPNVSYLVIVGDVTIEEAKSLSEKYFGKWVKQDVPKHEYKTPVADWDTRVAFVNKPGSVQSVINVTYPIDLKPGSADDLTAKVMNAILGGGAFSGRLMQNLREDKAWTYGSRSTVSPSMQVGYFKATASVRNEVTDSSVFEILQELTKMATTKVTPDELSLVKNNMNGTFALALESPQTIARFALNTERYNLPKDYYEKYLSKLEAITIEDVQAAAKKYIKPDNALVVVVGNKEEVAEKLGKFAKSGKVEFYDFQANPVKKAKPLPVGLTADKVIEDYVLVVTKTASIAEAKKKFDAIKDRTIVMSAFMEQMGQKMELEMARYTTKSGMLKSELKLKSMGMTVQEEVIGKDKGYTSNMQTGKTAYTPEEVKEKKAELIYGKEVKLAELGFKTELKSIEEVNGKDAYMIELTDSKGKKSYEYYAIDTKLKVQTSSTEEGPDGAAMTSTVTYGDYKEVKGILYPHNNIISAGPQEMDFNVTKMEVNSGLKDSFFSVD